MRSNHPNVIMVLTDDQGYGDLGCTGNCEICTPNIDCFYEDAVRFTDYHVAPLCAPTRGALFTGRRPLRNGVWATCWGRSILHENETTLAEIFQHNGYATGLFGKWHLGDNYPYRPQDRGFSQVLAHKGGGVGQTPDFWGNNYFDDVYFRNGKPEQCEGYCTDIWFQAAEKFVESHLEQPFFVCITTNAPHEPYYVAEKYSKLYTDNPNIIEPNFYGMITNIDDNFGDLRKKLKAWGIEHNTILIFMSDNGSSAGCRVDKEERVIQGYNAGMRGLKGSYYDGGHHVPFFIRWPNGGLTGGRDIKYTSYHVDFFPTLADLCNLQMPQLHLDGISLKPLLDQSGNLPLGRVEFMQYRQSTEVPMQWENAVLCDEWRLIRGKELYNIKTDPSQNKDLSSDYPHIVKKLRNACDTYWQDMKNSMDIYSPIYLGDIHENPTRLDAMDVMGDVAWNQMAVATAQKSTGRWRVKFVQPGKYRIELRRWPSELNLPIQEKLSSKNMEKLAHYPNYMRRNGGKGVSTKDFHPLFARLSFFEETHIREVSQHDIMVVFELTVTKVGETDLSAGFIDSEEQYMGAYYVYVEYISQS